MDAGTIEVVAETEAIITITQSSTLCSANIVKVLRKCHAKSRGFSGKLSRLHTKVSDFRYTFRGRICLLLGLGDAVHFSVLA